MDRGYGPHGHKESDMTKATQFTPTRTQTGAHCLLLKRTDRKGHANAAGTSLISLSAKPGLGRLARPVTDMPHAASASVLPMNILCPVTADAATAAAKSLVVSDSVRPHRRQPTRVPHPWDSPGKNTGVGCHFLLQCMKVKSESEVAQSCPTLRDSTDCSLPVSSVHGILQARVLEWGAIAFSAVTAILHLFMEV